VKVQVKVMNLL